MDVSKDWLGHSHPPGTDHPEGVRGCAVCADAVRETSCAEVIARKFWSAYTRLAFIHGIGLLLALPAWDELPENHRSAMVATAEDLLEQGTVVCGEHRMERT